MLSPFPCKKNPRIIKNGVQLTERRLFVLRKMQVLAFIQTPQVLVSSKKSSKKRATVYYDLIGSLPFSPLVPTRIFTSFQSWEVFESVYKGRAIRTHELNIGTGSGDYEERHENDKHNLPVDRQHIGSSSKFICFRGWQRDTSSSISFAIAHSSSSVCIRFSISLLTALAKSGFTAAFSLIFVSELADKTFFIAALLAMQHEQVMHCQLESMQQQLCCCFLVFSQLEKHGRFHQQWLTDNIGSQKSKEPAEEIMLVKLYPIEVLGMGRPLNAFATMALGAAQSPLRVSGKWSHCRPPASNIYRSTRRIISLTLHIRKTVWIHLRSFVFGVRGHHVF